jgi:esterase/lipase
MKPLVLFVVLAALVLLSGCIQLPSTGNQNQNTQNPPNTTPSQPPIKQYPDQTPSQTGTTSQTGTNTPDVPVSIIPSQEISYDSGGWTIYGTLYSAKEMPKRMIVLVPGLGTTRDSYSQSFVVKLHDQMPDALVLAIDPRGHGKSTNLGDWRVMDTAAFQDMRTDIINSKKYIVDKYPAVKQLYVVGASMGSTAAITAGAKEKSITKVVMLSPGMEFNKVDITSAISAYVQPLLVIASSGDAYSAQSAQQIVSMTSKSQTTLKIYPGSAHGTELFDATQGTDDPVDAVIIDFLK